MKLLLNPEYNLFERDGQAFCDSLQVAETFERRHEHVIRTIESLTDPTSGLSEQFRLLNFEPSTYKDASGKRNKKYLLTKDGFVMVTMEFKTARARHFKEAYICRFNQMEGYIRDLLTARMECPELTAAISTAHDTPKHYHFSNEMDMLNRIVTGQTAKQIRAAHSLPDGESIRPYLTQIQIAALTQLQRFDAGLVLTIPDYGKRKELLQSYYCAIMRRTLSA